MMVLNKLKISLAAMLQSFVTFFITAVVMVFCLKSKEVGLLEK